MESCIDCSLLSLEEAIAVAHEASGKPVILADVQDNPGAGGSSDTTGLLIALGDSGAKGVFFGLMHDHVAAGHAHEAGTGACLQVDLGGHNSDQPPLSAEFEVFELDDGTCRYTGDKYGGGIATLGKTAVLRLMGRQAEIDIVVTSIRIQCLDLAHFTHVGLDPESYSVCCVKSTLHFRADFESIASKVFPVAAPGAFCCDLREFSYENLHPTKRILFS